MTERDDKARYSAQFGVVVPPRSSQWTGRAVFGMILIVLGAVWTLDTLGVVESEPILRWWPLALVAFGLTRLLGIGGRAHIPAGTVFTLAGLWLLSNNLGLIHISLFDLWPLILIAIGASLLLRQRGGTGPDAEPSSSIHSFAVWSGLERKAVSQDFRGGDVSAVMGGVTLDLRGARIASGTAVLDVLAMWGGIDLRVPEDWRVVNEAVVVMGGIEDKTRIPPADATQTLILRGLVIMGGVEIKH